MVNKAVFFEDREGTWKKVADATVADGIFVIAVGKKKFKNIIEGPVRARQAGVYGNDSDQSARIAAALALADVPELIFDAPNENVVISTPLDIPAGKKLIFKNGCKVIVSAAVTGGLIKCDHRRQCIEIAAGGSVTLLENKEVSVAWWGAKNDYVYLGATPTNNHPFFVAAENSCKTPGTILIPGAEDIGALNGFYQLDEPWIVSRKLIIRGESKDNTVLIFPTTAGIKLTIANSSLADIYLKGSAGAVSSGINSAVKYGGWLASNGSKFDKCKFQSFDGDGIFVQGDVTGGTNANNCKVYDCDTIGNGRAGFYNQGGDANVTDVRNLNAEGNARYGTYNLGFLGDTFINIHSASNVHGHNFNKSICSRLGVYYWCIQDATNIEPTVTSGWQKFWVVARIFPSFSTVWSAAVPFLSGAGYGGPSNTAESVFVGCYDEFDQPAFQNNGRSLVLGGSAAKFGGFKGAIGNRNGFISSVNFQAYNINTGMATCIDSEGNKIGWRHVSGVPVGWGYAPSEYMHLENNGLLNVQWFLPGAAANHAAKFGRTTIPNGILGAWVFRAGYSMRIEDLAGDQFRSIKCFWLFPSKGVWSDGDIIIKMSPGGPLGWRCIRSGDFDSAAADPVFEELGATSASVGPEIVATFAGIDESKTSRMIYVTADETKAGKASLYIHTGKEIKFLQTVP